MLARLCLILIMGMLTFCGCTCGPQIVKPPMVEAINVDLREIGITESIADIDIVINNPNSFEGKVTEIVFDIYYLQDGGWQYMGHGEMPEKTNLEANDKTTIKIPTKIGNIEFGSALFQMLANGRIGVKVSGSIGVSVKPFTFEQPIEITTTVSFR